MTNAPGSRPGAFSLVTGNPLRAEYSGTMADIVNLNQFRKSKARTDKKVQADRNAVKFGRTKAEKQRDKAVQDQDSRRLDSHKRDD
ncbi:DUF4169 family protein [Phaeobacter italicus]|uniref:DUF4169 family protein n=1 Tax=Phaeobacter italicus TaxID=481446 RepID=UPI0031EB4983